MSEELVISIFRFLQVSEDEDSRFIRTAGFDIPVWTESYPKELKSSSVLS
jgi:hypothetical protein